MDNEKEPRGKRNPGKDLSRKDADLWKALTGDVERMSGKGYLDVPAEPEKPEEGIIRKGKLRTSVPLSHDPPPPKSPGRGLDKRTDERLRRGQMEIEARLDMHGMNQKEAQATLEQFIARCYQQGRRCVLVITGKGKFQKDQGEWFENISAPGILRARFAEWVEVAPLRDMILQHYPARPKDGGDGAFYVLLRRKR